MRRAKHAERKRVKIEEEKRKQMERDRMDMEKLERLKFEYEREMEEKRKRTERDKIWLKNLQDSILNTSTTRSTRFSYFPLMIVCKPDKETKMFRPVRSLIAPRYMDWR